MGTGNNLARYLGREVRIESTAPKEVFEGILYRVFLDGMRYICEIDNHGRREIKKFYFLNNIHGNGIKVPLNTREETLFKMAQGCFEKHVRVKDKTHSSSSHGPLEGRIVGLRLDGEGGFYYTLERNEEREEREGIYLDDIQLLTLCRDGDLIPIVGQKT